MLKGIPPIISPELVMVMMEMGHGDELVIADGNFPAAACAQRLVRADGHGVPPVLEAVLKLFPLDSYVERPVALMDVVPPDPVPAIRETYKAVIQKADPAWRGQFDLVERFAFYERAKGAFAIVATSEPAPYGNIILKKGCVKG